MWGLSRRLRGLPATRAAAHAAVEGLERRQLFATSGFEPGSEYTTWTENGVTFGHSSATNALAVWGTDAADELRVGFDLEDPTWFSVVHGLTSEYGSYAAHTTRTTIDLDAFAGLTALWVFGGDGDDAVHVFDVHSGLEARGITVVIRGGAGNDHVGYSGAANVTLYGDEGEDNLAGGEGNDALEGGAGWDWLWGNGGEDRLYGGADGDRLSGGEGVDFLDGGDAEDVITLTDPDGLMRDVVSPHDPEAFAPVLRVGGVVYLQGTADNDEFVVRENALDPSQLDFVFAGTTYTFSRPLDGYFVLDPRGGDDTVIRDLSNGWLVPQGHLFSQSPLGPGSTWRQIETGFTALPTLLPGESVTYNGIRFSCETLSDSPARYALTVTGTDGDDQMILRRMAMDPGVFELQVNRKVVRISLADLPAGALVILRGGAGHDTMVNRVADVPAHVYPLRFAVVLMGGDGDDRLSGSGSICRDYLWGGAGNDVIWGGSGYTHMDGGEGDDTLVPDSNSPHYVHLGLGEDALNWGLGERESGAPQVVITLDSAAAEAAFIARVLASEQQIAHVTDPLELRYLWHYTSAWGSTYVDTGPAAYSLGAEGSADVAGQLLRITGTAGDDEVVLSLDAADPARLLVTVNGVVSGFSLAAVTEVAYNLWGGNDRLTFDESNGRLTLPAWAYNLSTNRSRREDGVLVRRVTEPAQPPPGEPDQSSPEPQPAPSPQPEPAPEPEPPVEPAPAVPPAVPQPAPPAPQPPASPNPNPKPAPGARPAAKKKLPARITVALRGYLPLRRGA